MVHIHGSTICYALPVKIMKKLFPYIKILILSAVLLAAIGFVSGVLSTKQQISQNSCQWSKSISNGVQAHIVDSRDYDSYYFVLGTYDNQRAYLASYKKLPGIPLYTRYMIATNEYRDLTGIGFKLHGKFMELLISPPYTDILNRLENGVLCPAPETVSEDKP